MNTITKDITGGAYIAIPSENTFDTTSNKHLSLQKRISKKKFLVSWVLTLVSVVAFILVIDSLNDDDGCFHESHMRGGGESGYDSDSDWKSPDLLRESEWEDHEHCHHGHERKKKRGPCPHGRDKMFPTLLPGGGRDWVLSPQDGTIVAKHQADLVLGSTPHSNLILVSKGSKDAIVLDKDEMEKLSKGQEATMRGATHGLGLLYADKDEKKWGSWRYREAASLQGEQEMKQAVTLTYKDDNYLVLKQTGNREITASNGALVLDVFFWKLVEGNSVNFVGAATDSIDVDAGWWKTQKMWLEDTVEWFKPKTFIPGGGRDWVLNVKEGTISPKRAGNLVLGLGVKKVLLVKNTSPDKLVFEDLGELVKSNGNKSVPLIVNGTNSGVGQQYNTPKPFGPWKFIETAVVASDKAVSVRYVEDNYIVAGEEGKELALDISFWKMVEGNTVNFVGGKVYKAEDDTHGVRLPPPFGPDGSDRPPLHDCHHSGYRTSRHDGHSHSKHDGWWGHHHPHHGSGRHHEYRHFPPDDNWLPMGPGNYGDGPPPSRHKSSSSSSASDSWSSRTNSRSSKSSSRSKVFVLRSKDETWSTMPHDKYYKDLDYATDSAVYITDDDKPVIEFLKSDMVAEDEVVVLKEVKPTDTAEKSAEFGK